MAYQVTKTQFNIFMCVVVVGFFGFVFWRHKKNKEKALEDIKK